MDTTNLAVKKTQDTVKDGLTNILCWFVGIICLILLIVFIIIYAGDTDKGWAGFGMLFSAVGLIICLRPWKWQPDTWSDQIKSWFN